MQRQELWPVVSLQELEDIASVRGSERFMRTQPENVQKPRDVEVAGARCQVAENVKLQRVGAWLLFSLYQQ